MNEQEKFLEDLKSDQTRDPFEPPKEEEVKVEAEPEETEEESEMKLRNRRERRLAAKLQSEREANIDLNARLQTVNESRTTREGTEQTEYLKRLERIYGTDTPEKREATELLKEAFEGMKKSLREETFQEIEREQSSETKAREKEEGNLDTMMEELEEDFGADFSDTNIRTGFLTLLEKVSPKDRDGYIIEYADPATTWELFESRQNRQQGGPGSRAKELSSRSMTRSGAQTEKAGQMDEATLKMLRENGII